jgi:hypothetical protein
VPAVDPSFVRALRASLDAGGFAVAVILLVVVGLLVLAALRRRGAHASTAVLAIVGAWVTIAGVAELTLFGGAGIGADPRLYLDPIEGASGWRGIAWRPVIDNVTLFVPVGATVAAWWRRTSVVTVLLSCVALSLAVEGFQLLVPTGRIANSADVLANGTGAALGIGLAVLTGARRAPSAVDARRR